VTVDEPYVVRRTRTQIFFSDGCVMPTAEAEKFMEDCLVSRDERTRDCESG